MFCLHLSWVWVAFLVWSYNEDFLGCGQICFKAARFCWLYFFFCTGHHFDVTCLICEEDFLWVYGCGRLPAYLENVRTPKLNVRLFASLKEKLKMKNQKDTQYQRTTDSKEAVIKPRRGCFEAACIIITMYFIIVVRIIIMQG